MELGLGFRVSGLGFRVSGFGFRVSGGIRPGCTAPGVTSPLMEDLGTKSSRSVGAVAKTPKMQHRPEKPFTKEDLLL